jgi:alkylhydroperoxidase family enzyme
VAAPELVADGLPRQTGAHGEAILPAPAPDGEAIPPGSAPDGEAIPPGSAPKRAATAVTWLPDEAPGATPLDRVFGLCPELYEDFRRWSALFWEERLLDPVLLELCRLRVAQLHGCEAELRVRLRPALDAGLDEEKIAALPRASSDPRFSELERACLAFAELFVADPNAITDEDAARLTGPLGPEGTVALVQALALFDGFSRFRLMLGVEPPPEARVVVPAPAETESALA